MPPLRSLFRPVVVVLALALATSNAHAWSRRAHTIIGDIATPLLSLDAAREVGRLLVNDVGADGKPSGATSLGQVANWADELRAATTSVGPSGVSEGGTSVYHYDDIPICGGPDAVRDRAKYCADGKCGSAWFAKQLAILADRSRPERARNEALKWIVHLAGDLHQPLHASDHDDKGGNDVKITWFGKKGDEPLDGREQRPYNLHTVWDRLIPYGVFDAAGGDARFLASWTPDPTLRRAWEEGDILAWREESYVLARDFLYPALPLAWRCDAPIAEVAPLGENYVRPASVIATTQIRKAGVRLAKTLNDALGPRR